MFPSYAIKNPSKHYKSFFSPCFKENENIQTARRNGFNHDRNKLNFPFSIPTSMILLKIAKKKLLHSKKKLQLSILLKIIIKPRKQKTRRLMRVDEKKWTKKGRVFQRKQCIKHKTMYKRIKAISSSVSTCMHFS